MSEYILILIWIAGMAVVADRMQLKRTERVCGETKQRYPWPFAMLVFLPLIWMAGQRGWFADTTAYILGYYNMPDTFSKIPEYMASISKDKGFGLLSCLIKIIISDDYVVYLTVIAVLQGIALVMLFRRYSDNYIASVFLFVASTDYISWMFNGMRQFLAVCVVLLATPLMLKKKYVSLILVILLASTIHQSALLMIPFVFIAQGKACNKKTFLFIAMVLLAILFVDRFTDILGATLADTEYSHIVSDYQAFGDDGTHPLRVAVYCIPAIMAFVKRKQIAASNDKIANLCANMSIISMGLYIISMVTSGIYIGRLPIYVSLYGYILLPWELENIFTKKTKQTLYVVMVACYLFFYYYQMQSQLNLLF